MDAYLCTNDRDAVDAPLVLCSDIIDISSDRTHHPDTNK